jgi:DNA topoisomerase VI subunit A
MKAEDIEFLTRTVTKKWAKQRKAEERNARARERRDYMYSDRVCLSHVSRELIDWGYDHVSDHGRLYAPQRNIFYAVREDFRLKTGREVAWKDFTGRLLRAHLNLQHTENWKISRDPRGSLIEPHTMKEVGVGTAKIDQYLNDMGDVDLSIDDIEWEFPTCGPDNRYQALLYIEKEGFGPLLRDVKFAERFDIAIVSCKGQSVIAARKLVDMICHRDGIPLLVLHDFDKPGFSICHNLHKVSRSAIALNRVAYWFQNKIDVIDLGLRLDDVKRLNLRSERFYCNGKFDRDWDITEEEKEFLRSQQRVELNALIKAADFIQFLEDKVRGAGFKDKFIPADDALLIAFRRAHLVAKINGMIADAREDFEKEADALKLPAKLRKQIAKELKASPERSWDSVLYEIVKAQV